MSGIVITPGVEVGTWRFEYKHETGWIASGEVSGGTSALSVSKLEVRPAPGRSGVTASMLRKVPVGEILLAATVNASRAIGAVPEVFEDEPVRRRPGRAPLTARLLREVAVLYIAENAPGKPSGAMKRVADHFGKPEQTMRNWVKRARRDGWLGPSVKGRTGALPGPRLVPWEGTP